MISTSGMVLEFAHPQDLDHLQLRLSQLRLQASKRLDRMIAIIPLGQGPSDPLADDGNAPLRRYLRDEIEAIASEMDYLDWAHNLAQVDRDGDTSFDELAEKIGEVREMVRDLATSPPCDGTEREAARQSVRSSFRSAYARRRMLSFAWTSPMLFLLLGLNIATQSRLIVGIALCCAMALVLVGNHHINREFERMITEAESRRDRLEDLGWN